MMKYYLEEVCSKKESVNNFVNTVSYVSYGVMLISALPSKIVGL